MDNVILIGQGVISDVEYAPTFNGTYQFCASNISRTSGKYYTEVLVKVIGGSASIGVTDYTQTTTPYYFGANWSECGYYNNGNVYIGGTGGNPIRSGLAAYTTGDIIGILLNMDNKTVQFSKNGIIQSTPVLIGTTNAIIATSAYYVEDLIFNFGATPFSYPIPEGYIAYNGYSPNSPRTLYKTLDNKLYGMQ